MPRYGSLLEQLEVRSLLSSINVIDFGAKPDDGADDWRAVRAAMDSSRPGDQIVFAAGTYNFSRKLMLKGDGRAYVGRKGAILKGDPSHHIFHIQQDNTRVEGFTFDGKPIMLDKPRNEMVAGVVIDNNLFKLNSTGENHNAITFTTGLRNTTISNNRFEGGEGHGIYGYYWDKLRIANNEFVNLVQAIHIDDHSDHSRDLLVEQNYFAGIRRMAIEYQGGGHNSIFQDNWYEKPNLGKEFNTNNETFAYSIIATRSVGMIARRNVVIAPERPDGVGVRIAFEVGGDNALVEDNYISGVNHVLAANDFEGSTSVTARNNFFENVLQGPVGRNLKKENNGPGAKLSWNVKRGRPQRNLRFDQAHLAPIETGTVKARPTATKKQQVALTDLIWRSQRSSWGPAERDRTNGTSAVADGGKIKLDGKTYRRGLGVAANSQITYNLNGRFATFLADIGIDDRAGDNGSVVFQIWADGKPIYVSTKLTGRDKALGISIDVSGVKELKLITRNAGDGDKSDHANWAGARLMA